MVRKKIFEDVVDVEAFCKRQKKLGKATKCEKVTDKGGANGTCWWNIPKRKPDRLSGSRLRLTISRSPGGRRAACGPAFQLRIGTPEWF